MLTSNEQYLVEQLMAKEEFQSFQSLAESLNVSVRTIRNLLHRIQPFLTENNLKVERKYGVGIRLTQIEETEENVNIIPFVDFSAIYRREVLKLLLLLNFRQKTSINKLAEQFYVSKNAIFLDLKIIEKELWIYNLCLERDHKGTKIKGKRKLIKRAIIDIVHQFGISILYENNKYISDNENILYSVLNPKFEQLIVEVLCDLKERCGYRFNFDFLQTLIIHLSVDILLFGKGSKKQEEPKTAATAGEYFQMRIETALMIHFSQRYNKERFQEYCTAFSFFEGKEGTNHSAAALLESFEDISGIELRDKDGLINELNQYLYQIELRQEYRIAVFHPMLNHFLSNYGAQFVALKLAHWNQPDLNVKMTDDEIAFELVYVLNHCYGNKRDFQVLVKLNASEELQRFVLQKLEKEFPLSSFHAEASLEYADMELAVTFSPDSNTAKSRNEIDLNNPKQLELLREKIAYQRAEKIVSAVEEQFDYHTFLLEVPDKKRKDDVLAMIKTIVLKQYPISEQNWFDLIEEDKINPTFWIEKQAALLVLETEKVTRSSLLKFELPIQVRWRNNNELSRVRKVYFFLSKHVELEESTTLYKAIQFDRTIKKIIEEEENE